MATKQVNLAKVFGTVATALASNRDTLNQADTYNHDHGDNMVEVFDVVAQAMKAKKGASPADQLAYASELLRQKESGSAKYYAGGLMQAAQQFTGKQVTPNNAMELIQTLLGGGMPTSSAAPAASGQADMLGSLLSGLTGTRRPGHRGPAQCRDVVYECQTARRGRHNGADGCVDVGNLRREHRVSRPIRSRRSQRADAGRRGAGGKEALSS